MSRKRSKHIVVVDTQDTTNTIFQVPRERYDTLSATACAALTQFQLVSSLFSLYTNTHARAPTHTEILTLLY